MITIYTKNDFGVEILNTDDVVKWVAEVVFSKDIGRLERAIFNTYTRDDAFEIIKNFNLLLGMVGE